jgi:hypothetical protein
MPTTAIASWLCKCGVTVKVEAELNSSQPMATVKATCPKCGDEQIVYGYRILSVTSEKPVKIDNPYR